jgi:hypothetical protein
MSVGIQRGLAIGIEEGPAGGPWRVPPSRGPAAALLRRGSSAASSRCRSAGCRSGASAGPAGRWSSSCPRTSQDASVSDRPVAEETITDPRHPLYGQRLAVFSLRAGRGPAWIAVSLPDGRCRSVRRAATDLAGPPPADHHRPLVSVPILLPLARLVRDLSRISSEEIPHGSDRPSFEHAASPDAGAGHLDRCAPVVAGTTAADAPAARPGAGPARRVDADAAPQRRGIGYGGDPC